MHANYGDTFPENGQNLNVPKIKCSKVLSKLCKGTFLENKTEPVAYENARRQKLQRSLNEQFFLGVT